MKRVCYYTSVLFKWFVKELFCLLVVIQTITPTILYAINYRSFDSVDDDKNVTVDYSKFIPLGRNSRTNLYWDGEWGLLGEDGTYIYLQDVIPDTVRNGEIEFVQKSGVMSCSINADSIYGEGILTFKSTLPLVETSFIICDSIDTEDEASFMVSIEDIPVGSPHRKAMLSYISSCLYCMYGVLSQDEETDSLSDLKIFVPTDSTSIKDMEYYYASGVNDFFSIQIQSNNLPCYYHYEFEKALESRDYITYTEFDHVRAGKGSIWGYGTQSYVTFDKRKGTVVEIDDIIDAKYECLLRYLLRQDMIRQDASVGFLTNVPIGNMALSQNGLVFSYSPWELTMPSDLIFNLFVSYDDIKGLTKIKTSKLSGLKSGFHKVAIVRKTDDGGVCRFKSSEDVSKTIKKVENNTSVSGLFDMDYCNYDCITTEELITYRDSLLKTDGKKHLKLVNELISEREAKSDTDYEKEFDFDLEEESFRRASEFIKSKSWDMAIRHILIALANQPNPEEDAHDSFLPEDSASTFLSGYPNFKEVDNNGKNKYIDNLLLLGDVSMKGGFKDRSTGYYKRASSILNYLLKKTFIESFPAKRNAFWNRYSDWYMNSLPNIAYKTNDDTLKVAAYNGVLTGRGLLLNTERSERQAIYDSKDPVLLGLLTDEADLKKGLTIINDSLRLISNQLKKSSADEMETFKTIYVDLEKRSRVMSDSLSKNRENRQKRIVNIGRLHQTFEVRMSDISGVLKEGEIAIEFTYYKGKNVTTYYALSIKSGQKVPSITRLFTEDKLPDADSPSQDLRKLYRLVWKPLKNELNGINSIYFSPTKCLNEFSIEYAISPSGVPINQLYNVYRLSSTGELFTRRAESFKEYDSDGAVLFGGLNYDADKDFLKRDYMRYSHLDRGADNSSDKDYLIEKNKLYSFLPGTRTEVKAIKEVMESNRMVEKVFLYQDTIGTENLFKSLSGKHFKLIHIATHGGTGEIEKESSGEKPFVDDIYDNELRKAYLVFAGANNTSKSISSTDGLVDGMEISSMNLSDLDIAVLSACESGKGTITNEGVNGLQNAFKKAGAWTLMMSLRRVHDDATRLLMTYFYENLSQGKSINESFTDAQTRLREYRNGLYSDPYYWANFIILDAL